MSRLIINKKDHMNGGTDENGNIKTDKDCNAISKMRDVSGFESVESDVRNFGTNTAGALVGATGTVINTVKTTYDTITDEKSSITQIGRNWKEGQNSLTTALVRGSDDTVKEIMDKINKGEATPEELQYIASRTSKDEKGNLIFTSDGKSIIVKDADGRVGEQLGFNDKTTHQGYVDAGKTATDSRAFMTVDSEERIHNTIESENVAKNMANREVGYYNAIAFLTGGKGLATSNKSNNGGMNSQMQSNWNDKYNTSTNALLAQNTYYANQVKSENKLYSVFVDSKGKIRKVIDDGDFNAYRVKDSVSREDIEKDPEKYKNNNILYVDIFGIDNKNKLSGKDLTLTEQLFNNKEVHKELLLLDSFDKKLSITDNATNLLMSGKLDVDTFFALQNAVNNGADDNKLLYNLNYNLFKNLYMFNTNPKETLSTLFNLNIKNNIAIDVIPSSVDRTVENGGCKTDGCGEFEANRIRKGKVVEKDHKGLDRMADYDAQVVAPFDAIFTGFGNTKDPAKNNGNPVLQLINFTSIDGKYKAKVFYIKPETTNLSIGDKVKQGDPVIKLEDLTSSKYKQYDKSNPIHGHYEILKRNKNGKYIKIDPKSLIKNN